MLDWVKYVQLLWIAILLLAVLGLKIFVCVTLISANVLYLYLIGFMVMFLGWVYYLMNQGAAFLSLVYYRFLSSLDMAMQVCETGLECFYWGDEVGRGFLWHLNLPSPPLVVYYLGMHLWFGMLIIEDSETLLSLYAFLKLLALIESFGLFFNTITISNRLSINLFAGSLLMCIVGVAIWLSGLMGVVVFVGVMLPLFLYELFNTMLQVLIFLLLSSVYSMD